MTKALIKSPGAPEFPWHQDNGYSGLKDRYYQLWIALTPMTHENGGLWIKPKSHRTRIPHSLKGNHMVSDVTPEDPIFISAESGDIILFSSWLLHRTNPNVSQMDRWAYVAEYMSFNDFDPTIKPPYLCIARNGVPHKEFINFYRGRLSLRNQLKYIPLRVKRGPIASARHVAASALRGLGLR